VVVTFATAQKAFNTAEAVATQQAQAAPTTAALTPVQQAALLASLGQALRELENASKEVDPDVLVAPTSGSASRLQSFLASGEKAASTLEPLLAGGRELKFATNDALGWALSVLDHVRKSNYHALVRPSSTQPGVMPEKARLAVLGDWGTGMYGAPISAQSIAADPNPYWMLMHLGDVYYSGTLQEIQDRFLGLWPKRDGTLNRALNSNHEMYSGGHGYFDGTLVEFEQESSYFAYQNEKWLLLGLDTGYVDHDLDDEQAAWVNYVAGQAPGQRIVLFSHHQPFSRLSDQGPKLLSKLKVLLESGRVAAWYWGHEHACVLYDKHPGYGLMGRCIGHGGIPYTRKVVLNFPDEDTIGDTIWRRFGALGPAPDGLVLDGPNPYISGKEEKYGPHGYATLEFDGDALTERIHAPDGTELSRTTIR